MQTDNSDFWVGIIVSVLCFLYMAFEAGRYMERKHVAACPMQNGKKEVRQVWKTNGDVVCVYVRDVTGLATWEVKR